MWRVRFALNSCQRIVRRFVGFISTGPFASRSQPYAVFTLNCHVVVSKLTSVLEGFRFAGISVWHQRGAAIGLMFRSARGWKRLESVVCNGGRCLISEIMGNQANVEARTSIAVISCVCCLRVANLLRFLPA
jgi:hypothetical protein